MPDRIRYRKLPGHRRGFIRGSSVWLGPDHLLAVHSLRFREEYKRYYFRDIQAITIARAPRFHLSTRAAFIGYWWVVAFAALFRVPHGMQAVSAIGIALIAAWVYVSALCSCTCKIHTAVSQDRLPSVYRTWVARRFLQAVETHVYAIQGRLEQPLPDLEAVPIGPAKTSTVNAPSPMTMPPLPPRQRALSFPLLTGLLLANSLWNWLQIREVVPGSSLVSNGAALLEIVVAILIVVQHQRQKAGAAQQKLAIATLLGIGLFFYGTFMWAAVAAGIRTATRQAVDTAPMTHLSAQLNFAATLVLGLAGLAILILDKPASQEQGGRIS